MAQFSEVTGNFADLERREREGHAIPASSHHADPDAGAVLAGRQRGSAEGAREGRSDDFTEYVVEEVEDQPSNRLNAEKARILIPASYGVLKSLG